VTYYRAILIRYSAVVSYYNGEIDSERGRIMNKVECYRCGAKVHPFTVVTVSYQEGICRQCARDIRGGE
jgi:hypothetical protein